MLFSCAMAAYPEKLLAAYKVEGADGPMPKMILSGMSMQFFSASITLMIASRSSKKTISHVAAATWMGLLVSAAYTAFVGMEKSKAAGIPADGLYFNIAMSLFFAFLNFQAHQDTGALKAKWLGNDVNNLVWCIRANMLCGLIFGVMCVFAGYNMIENYMPGAPENAIPFTVRCSRTWAS